MTQLHPAFQTLARHPGGAAWHLRHTSGAEVVLNLQPLAPPFAALSLGTPAPDNSGVAHVLEHMVFRGSQARPVDDLYAQMMLAGPVTDLNASTLAERTTFHLTAASDAGRDAAFAVLAEAVFAPLLVAGDLEEERFIVGNEMRGHWADPVRAAMEGIRARLFPDGPQARAHAGLPAAIARLTRADLVEFHERFYRRGRAQIVLRLQDDPKTALLALDGLLRGLPEPSLGRSEQRQAPGFQVPIALDPGQAVLAAGWRLQSDEVLWGSLLQDLLSGPHFSEVGVNRALAAVDAASPDLRIVFAPGEADAVREAARGLPRRLTDALPRLAAGLPAAFDRLLAALAEEPAPTWLDRIAGPWSQGGNPLAWTDPMHALERMERIATRPAEAEAMLRRLLAPENGSLAVFESMPADPPSAMVRPGPSAPRPGILRFDRAVPKLPSLPHLSGALPWLFASSPGDGLVHRLLALPLNGVSTDELALAGGLARGLAQALGMQVEPCAGPLGAWMILSRSLRPDRVRDFDRRLQAALAGPPPSAQPPPALPLHLRIERRLWARLSASGAVLAAVDAQAALPTRALPLWQAMTRGPGLAVLASDRVELNLPALMPVPAQAREPEGPGQAEWLVTGRLSTLGLGLRMVGMPGLPLIAHALEWLFLRENVRREGGAYGVRARLGPEGVLVMLAAADPQPEASFSHFAASPDWLERELNGDLLQSARAGCLQRLARVSWPGEALALALGQHLAGGPSQVDVFRAVAELDEAGVRAIAARMRTAMGQAHRMIFRGKDL